MQEILLWITCLISLIQLSLQFNWIAEYRPYSISDPTNKYIMNQGAYIQIVLNLTIPNDELPKHTHGEIEIVTSEDFQMLPNKLSIDTIHQRQYYLHIGLSCQSLLLPKDYTITFKYTKTPESSANITFQPLIINLTKDINPLTIIPMREVLEMNSYSLYSIESVKNVDSIAIIFKKEGLIGKGTIIEDKTIPSYDHNKRKGMHLYGTYSSIYEDGSSIYSAKPQLDNKCFKITEEITWRMIDKVLPVITDKKSLILKEIRHVVPDRNLLRFQMKLPFQPVLVSCAMASFHMNQLLTEEIITNPNDNLDRNENFDLFQSYYQNEGTIDIVFQNANRFSLGMTVQCYIQTLIYKDNTQSKTTLGINISNNWKADKSMTLKSEAPFPTQCITWRFHVSFHKESFAHAIVSHCQWHFSTRQSLYDQGCLKCSIRNPSFFSGTDIGLCIHSTPDCPMNYLGDIKADAKAYFNTINSHMNLEENIPLVLPQLSRIYYESDDSPISITNVSVVAKEQNDKRIRVSIETMNNQSLDCYIKKLSRETNRNVNEGSFQDNPILAHVFPDKTNDYYIDYKNAGYDNLTYNIWLMCSNIAGFDYHSQHTKPLLGTTILRTHLKPLKLTADKRSDCVMNKMNHDCINIHHHPLPPLKNNDYRTNYAYEWDDFGRLAYGYRNIMVWNEIINYPKLTMRNDIIDKTFFILGLLARENCIEQPNYKYCSDMTHYSIEVLLEHFIKQFPSNDLKNSLISISSQHRKNIPVIAMILYSFSNIADGYYNATFTSLYQFNELVLSNIPSLLEIIDLQEPASESQQDKEKCTQEKANAKKDFMHLMLLTQINLLDITNHLEVDKALQKNETIQLLTSDTLITIRNNIEDLLPYMGLYGYKNISHNHFQLDIFDKKTPNDDEEKIKYPKQNIQVEFEKKELMKYKGIEYMYIFMMDKHPLISYNSTHFNSHTVSFRFYKKKDDMLVKSVNTKLSEAPKIKFTLEGSSKNFTEGFWYNEEERRFVNGNVDYKFTDKKGKRYIEVKVKEVGDVTVGNPTMSDGRLSREAVYWIIISATVGALILIGGIASLIGCWLRKKNSVDRTESLVRNEALDEMGI